MSICRINLLILPVAGALLAAIGNPGVSAAQNRQPPAALSVPGVPTPSNGAAPVADVAAPRTPPAPVNRVQPNASPDYRIGPGDVLKIEVANAQTMTWTGRVSNSGKIHIPLLGIIRINEVTAASLEAQIGKTIRDKGLLNDPWVTVRILEYRAQPVYVLGEVILPGQFVITSEMYVNDLLALAQGFNEVASPIGYLYRRKPNAAALPPEEAPADEAIPIDFKALNLGTKPELNIKLQGGDVLYVPQAALGSYYVVGDVRSPGAVTMLADNISASEAIAKAGGPLRTAKAGKGILVRFDEKGTREEIPVDFDAILRGKKPDVAVKANDIIFIPGSSTKTIGYGLLGIVPQAVVQPAAKAVPRGK